MQRFALTIACLLAACVLDEATPEDVAESEGEVESAATTIGPAITTLTDGVPVTVSAAANTVRYFKLDVPAGFDHMSVRRSGYLSGSGTFYMRRNQLPGPTNYDCTSSIYQGCMLDMPVAGTYYIAVYAGGVGYSNLTFTANHYNSFTPISNGYSATYYNQYGIDRQYKLVVPDGVGSLSFTYTLDPADDGRLDMVVKRNAFANDMNYDCIKWIAGYEGLTKATCTFTNPTPGTYYVALLGYNTKVVGTFSARYKFALTTTSTLNSTTN